jgi:tRNA A22 N-methylase
MYPAEYNLWIRKIIQEREATLTREIILRPNRKFNKLRHVHDKLQKGKLHTDNVKLLQIK